MSRSGVEAWKSTEAVRVLTFDIEDWFHILDNESTSTPSQWDRYEARVERNTDRILELLSEHKQRATFFCLGWVARVHRAVVQQVARAGFEIASHSYAHALAYTQDRQTFRADLVQSVDEIEQATGQRVSAYRAPGFSITKDNPWVVEILAECGIEVDSSIFPGSRAHGGLAHFGARGPAVVSRKGMSVKEFPVSLFSVLGMDLALAGGGYFRMLPYALTRRLVAGSRYVMTYFHPRDFDPGQPHLPGLSVVRRYKSYCGLSGAIRKLESLLEDFEFVDLRTAVGMVDWNRAETVEL